MPTNFVLGKASLGVTPITVWYAATPSDLPLSGVAEGDIGITTSGFIYARDINSNGWTLKFDPTDSSVVVSAEDVEGLQAAVEGFLSDELAGKAALSHTHAEADVSGLVSDLAGKASSVHTHAEGDITNLVSDLAGKQPLDSDLTTIAGLTATTGSVIQSVGSAWAAQTAAQLKTSLVLVKADVGLGSVDNTSDASKPVSTAQQTALDLKQNLDTDLTTIAGLTATTDNVIQSVSSAWASRTPAQLKTTLALVKGDVGLGSVDNTSDASKPVSTATQTALDLKANLASPTFSGTPSLPTGTTATTQAASDSSTKLATTAFVAAALNPSYSPGSFTVATETGRLFINHLKLTSSQRATLAGTARLKVSN